MWLLDRMHRVTMRLHSIMLVIIIKLLVLNIIIKPNQAWYDTSTSVSDLFSLENGTISKHHNPKDGTMVLRKRSRTDTQTLDMINTIRSRQATPEERKKREKMRMNPPIIGHMSPIGGPMSGDTTVKFWGTNFGGGSLYKCLFGKYVDNEANVRSTQ